jgi:hypothetical protein
MSMNGGHAYDMQHIGIGDTISESMKYNFAYETMTPPEKPKVGSARSI